MPLQLGLRGEHLGAHALGRHVRVSSPEAGAASSACASCSRHRASCRRWQVGQVPTWRVWPQSVWAGRSRAEGGAPKRLNPSSSSGGATTSRACGAPLPSDGSIGGSFARFWFDGVIGVGPALICCDCGLYTSPGVATALHEPADAPPITERPARGHGAVIASGETRIAHLPPGRLDRLRGWLDKISRDQHRHHGVQPGHEAHADRVERVVLVLVGDDRVAAGEHERERGESFCDRVRRQRRRLIDRLEAASRLVARARGRDGGWLGAYGECLVRLGL